MPDPTFNASQQAREKFQQELASALDSYHDARAGTKQGLLDSGVFNILRTEQEIVGFQQQSVDLLSRKLADMPSHAEKECRSGCAFCCYQRIDVSALEAIGIAGALRLTRTPEQLEVLQLQLTEHAEQVKSLTKQEYARQRIPCIFLNSEKNCSLYPVRPTACIGWHSMSQATCAAVFESGDPATQGVPSDYGTLLQAQGFASGVQDACQTQNLNRERFELHSAVLTALQNDNIAQQWLSGDNVFADCTPGLVESNSVLQMGDEQGNLYQINWKQEKEGIGTFEVVKEVNLETESKQPSQKPSE